MSGMIDEELYSQCPYPHYERLREGPVREQPGIGYVVTRYEDVIAVLRDSESYSAAFAPGFASTGLTLNPRPATVDAIMSKGYPECPALAHTDGETHKRHRSIVNPAFTPRQVAQREPRILAVTDELIDAFIHRGRVELLEEFSAPLPLTIVTEALGVPRTDLGLCREWSRALQGIRARHVPDDEFIGRAHKYVEFQRYFGAMIEERRAKPTDDLLSVIVTEGDASEPPLNMGELMNICAQLLLGGNETTASTLNSAMLALAQDEYKQRVLREQPSLIPSFVEEVLRRDAPVLGIPRIATKDTKIGGVEIPSGARLFVLFGSANRDGAVFVRPDDLEVERLNVRSHVAFGAGVHFCIGAPLARAELRIGLQRLLARLRSFSLAPGYEPVYEGGPMGHRLESLDLVFTAA